MPSYKLIYFDLEGRAEMTRLLFAQAKIPFQDVRVTSDEWKKMKPDTVFGQLPVLEIDGVQYCQSAAINGYLAQKYGLAGKTELDGLKVAMIGACVGDIISKFPFSESDEQKKEKAFADALDNTVPPMLKKLEGMMAGKYFLGDCVSAADIGVMLVADFIEKKRSGYMKNFQKIKACMEAVKSLPNIVAYYKK